MVAVTSKTRTIQNGMANDGSVVDQSFIELYNNDQALAGEINAIETGAFTFTGVKKFGTGLNTDIISEQTDDTGVSIDGLKIQDGDIAKYRRIGCIELIAYPENLLPNHLIICDGREVSRTTYDVLFTAIGTTWGVGNGSSTFNVPDLRGVFPLGKDNMGGIPKGKVTSASKDGNLALNLAGIGGAEMHKLKVEEMPVHQHTEVFPSGSGSGQNYNGSDDGPGTTLTGPAGGDLPHNNMPPWCAINYAIVAL